MSNSTNGGGGGLGFSSVLALIFITLKLTGVITWSWWWVLSPFWIALAIIAVLFTAIGILHYFSK